MKNLFLTITILLFSVIVEAQSSISKKDSTVEAFRNYLLKKTRYPAVARENNVQGTAVLAIKVDDGKKINSITIVRHLSAEIDSELIQRIKSYNGMINLPQGQYTFGYQFTIHDDDDNPNVKPIKSSRYNNYLFDINIIAYSVIRKTYILN